MNILEIEKKITKNTKAIAIVHFLRNTSKYFEIKKIAKKYNLFVLEDCALAVGAGIIKKHVGTIGDVEFSLFYPVKRI